NSGQRAVLLSDEDLRLLDLETRDITVLPLDQRTRALAVDALSGRTLVMDETQRMHFIDPQSLEPYQAPLKAGPTYGSLVIDTARGLGLVIHGDRDRIVLLDIVSGTLAGTVQAQGELVDLAVHVANGQVFAIERGALEDALIVVDTANRLVLDRKALDARFTALAVDEARDRVMLARQDHASIQVLDLATGERTTLDTAAPVDRMALNIGHEQIALLSVDEGRVVIVDLENQETLLDEDSLGGVVDLAVSEHFHALLMPDPARQALVKLPLPARQPRLRWIDPEEVIAGRAEFELTIHGNRFINGARARVGHTWQDARWHSAARLLVNVPEALVAAPGVLEVVVEFLPRQRHCRNPRGHPWAVLRRRHARWQPGGLRRALGRRGFRHRGPAGCDRAARRRIGSHLRNHGNGQRRIR
ncbi:MAG: hypothetical protein LC667_12220, partial [Thioalkalivibrio sp.]|nr:hypothetical protein [Thioalkalivibrio sp.]